jgi:predicted transcriptional regulator
MRHDNRLRIVGYLYLCIAGITLSELESTLGGDPAHERHLAFESWDMLARVLTNKRTELLRYVRRHEVPSIRALAKALHRDYRNVHADVQALTAAGLLSVSEEGVNADYDTIVTRIAI